MIRPGGAHDVPFLRDMLRHAFPRTPVGDEPPLSRYVDGWGRRGDRAVIAIEHFQRVGAAWYRLFKESNPGFGFVDEETPELAIAVVPSRRGRGFGGELLQALLEQARRDGYPRLTLSVEQENPAAALYEKYGFERVGERNGSWTMLANFAKPS